MKSEKKAARYVTLATASKLTGYSTDHIQRLGRERKIKRMAPVPALYDISGLTKKTAKAKKTVKKAPSRKAKSGK
jgi:hypothetical protein